MRESEVRLRKGKVSGIYFTKRRKRAIIGCVREQGSCGGGEMNRMAGVVDKIKGCLDYCKIGKVQQAAAEMNQKCPSHILYSTLRL